jgi:hypothetical protein
MSPRLAVMVLAMLAALVVAPSSVFAAAPNALYGAAFSPSAGTTATLFELSVSYSGSGPANVVTATVAGKTVALGLSSGGLLDGTWTGGTTLPAGSWMVTFQANASQGHDPKPVSVGPINVSPVVTQPPVSPIAGQPSDTADPGDASPTAAETKPLQSTAPSTNGSAAPVGGSAEPTGGAAAAASAGASASQPDPRDSPHGRSAGTRASSSPDGGAAPASSTAGAGTAGGTQAAGSEQLGTVLLFGIAGVAAVALLGAAWILIASRRDRTQRPVVVGPPVDPALTAIPTVEQRAARRARLRPSDDPILAALGLNDEEPSTPDGGHTQAAAGKRRFRRAARSQRPES